MIRILVAASAILVAIALRVALEPMVDGQLPYITIFGAVAVCAWFSGAALATIAAAAGFMGINALVPDHPAAQGIDSAGFWIALFGFAMSSGLILVFGAWTQRELGRRRSAEARAHELSEQFQATLKSIGDGVIVVDLDGHVMSLNPIAETLTGWTHEEAYGQPLDKVFDIVSEDTMERVANPALRALAEGCIVGLANHTVLRARSGPQRPIEDSAAPIRLPDGSIRGVVLVFRDSSTRRQQEADLRQSEALLRAMYEGTSMSMGVVELLDDGDILHLQDNAGTCRIFGVPLGGTAYRRASELGAPRAIIDLWVRHYQESAGRGGPVRFDFQLQSPDGLSWQRATVSPLPVGASGMPRFSYVCDDITAQHATERLIRVSEAKSRMALAVAQIGIWSWDPDSDVIEADARCRSLAGLAHRGALRFADVMPRVHPDDREAVLRAIDEALAPDGTKLYAAEFRFVHPDGSVRWVVSRGQVLPAEELIVEGRRLMLGSVLDITARKQAEESLARSDQRKSQFIATLAHELRNPLAPIRSGLTVLQLTDDARVRHRTLAMQERQVKLLVRMIDDLLDLSRIDRDQLELHREPLDLVAVVHSAVEVSQPLIDAHGHQLRLMLPDDPIHLIGDSARLTQLLSNLLNNAAKYTPAGGNIKVTAELREATAVVSVEDNGIGIPPEMLEQVFEMFAQVDRKAAQAQSGLGIGLAIGRRLAELHGGSVVAMSDGEGRGSRFVVSLPLATLHGAATPPTVTSTDASRPLRRVLVVDDNVDAADSLCQLLALMGHSADAVHDGASALALAERMRPEVIFLDLGMPVMDGHQIARELRSQAWARSTLLVALTGWGQPGDRERSAASGCDLHLVKPVSTEALLEIFEEHLGVIGRSDMES